MSSVVEHRTTIATPADTIYRVYADVVNWHRWDPDTRAASLNGPFAVGSRGRLTPTKGNTVSMVVTFADPAQGFTVESRIPLLLRMVFEHELIAKGPSSTGVAGMRVRSCLLPPKLPS